MRAGLAASRLLARTTSAGPVFSIDAAHPKSAAVCRCASNSRSTVLIASTTAWAEVGRSSGFLASRRITSSPKAGGTAGFRSPGGEGVSVASDASTVITVSPGNGN